MPDEFRIEYSVKRCRPGEDDFTEIGFGSSGTWNDIDSAAYAIETDLQQRQWETSEGMPEPTDV